MRPLSLLPALLPAALLAFASSASAQELPYPQPAAVSTVQVTAPPRTIWIQRDQARELAGYYAMSNGWEMKVRPASRHIDATIDNQPPIRLFHVERARFVSSDGTVRMRFNQGDAGDEMTMSYVPDGRLAQAVVISARMAQR